jgi:hypothetical protein
MEVRSKTRESLEKAVRYLRDNPEEEVIYYHQTTKLAAISTVVFICNDMHIPYEIESNRMRINRGEFRFVRS